MGNAKVSTELVSDKQKRRSLHFPPTLPHGKRKLISEPRLFNSFCYAPVLNPNYSRTRIKETFGFKKRFHSTFIGKTNVLC